MPMKRPMIMVVDDDRLFVEAIEKFLRASGYDVAKAFDGEECLKVARENWPDLILLDVLMPKMNGFEAIMKLKEDSKTASVPIIVLSGMDDKKDAVAALLVAGAVGYITKPYNTKDLLEKIKAELRQEKI